MTEMGMKVESEIKLFGKTILVSDSSSSSSSSPSQDTKASSIEETLTQATSLSDTTNDRNRPSKEDSLSHNGSKNEQEASESSGASQDGTAPKKPDKILPCPRCNSVDTKFCYYNNYNVKQPRYFCKNCQRYWTSGGAMRNVPVGSGRRKHKTFSIPTNYHHVIISDAHPVSMTPNGYLIFGSHATTSCELPDVSGKPQNSRLPFTLYRATPFWGSTLGKHTREEAAFGVQPAGSKKGIPLNKEGSIHVSSNSRIVDSKRIAMGCMENERFGFGYGMGLFGSTTTTILEANPAALSRSLNFHENV